MNAESVGIRPARSDDLPAIMALERAGFADSAQWSEQGWIDELAHDLRTVLTATRTEPAATTQSPALLGVISLQTVGESSDLHRVVVDPQSRRHGVGTALVLSGLAAVAELGARQVILEVEYDNESAIALYQRLGFEQFGARSNYYGPGQDALIMKYYGFMESDDLQGEHR